MNDELQLISKLITDIKQTTTKLTPNSKKKLSVTDIKTSIKNQKKDVTKFNESLEVYHQQVADMFKQIGKKFETIEDMKKDLKEDENLPPKTDKDKAKFETIQIKQLNVLNNNIDNLLFFLKDELYDLKNIKPEVSVVNKTDETKISLKPFFDKIIEKIKPLDSDSFLGQIKDFVIGSVIGLSGVEIIKWLYQNKEALQHLIGETDKNEGMLKYAEEQQSKITSLQHDENMGKKLTATEKIQSGIKQKYGNLSKATSYSVLSQLGIDSKYYENNEIQSFSTLVDNEIQRFLLFLYQTKNHTKNDVNRQIKWHVDNIMRAIPRDNQYSDVIFPDRNDVIEIFDNLYNSFKDNIESDTQEFQIDTQKYDKDINTIIKQGNEDFYSIAEKLEKSVETFKSNPNVLTSLSGHLNLGDTLNSIAKYITEDFIPYWRTQIFTLNGSYITRLKYIKKQFETTFDSMIGVISDNEYRNMQFLSVLMKWKSTLWNDDIQPYFDKHIEPFIVETPNVDDFKIKDDSSVISNTNQLDKQVMSKIEGFNTDVVISEGKNKTVIKHYIGVTPDIQKIKQIREEFKRFLSIYIVPEISQGVPSKLKGEITDKLQTLFDKFISEIEIESPELKSNQIYLDNRDDMIQTFNNILNEITIYNENDITVDVQKFQDKKRDETKENYDASVEAVLKNDTSKQTINSAIDTQNSTQGVKVATGFENVGYATTQRGDYGTRGEISVKSDKIQSPTNVKGNQNSHITNVLNKTSVKTPSTKVIQVEPKIIVQNSSQQINHIDYVIDRISFRGDIPTLLNN